MKSTLLIKGIILKGLALLLGFSSYGQLPSDYLTKVSYHEKKTVSYYLPSQAVYDCLSYRELAEYHGFMQFYKIDEYVDLDGQILLDKNYMEEYQVSDDWMESFSRIIIGKNTMYIYDSDGALFHQTPRIVDSSTVFISPTEAANYQYLDLNTQYFDSLEIAYSNLGFIVTKCNDGLTAVSPDLDIVATYDHSLKIASCTEFDSLGTKTKETVIEYALNHEGDTYFPETETIYEWITTDSSCCVSKVTVYNRYEFERELSQGSSSKIEKPSRLSDMLEVMTDPNANAFRIVSEKYENETFDFTVYDMAGKLIISGSTTEDVRVELPQGMRVGMYVVHVSIASKNTSTVKKIIKNKNSQTF